MRRPLLCLALAAALCPAAAAAQPQPARAAASAAVADVRYELGFTRDDARRRQVRVAMHFTSAERGTAPLLLSMPAWTPGAYELSHFARFVVEFAVEVDGHPAAWERADHDTWRVQRPASGPRRFVVRYTVRADTLDNGMAWTRPDFLLLNGTAAFLYPEGRPLDRYPAQVRWTTEPAWRVATGMRPAGDSLRFAADSYHDLVDMPFFVGRFDLDSVEAGGRPMRLATYPAGSVAGARRRRALEQLRRYVAPAAAVFGEVPWDAYTVMQVADSSYGGFSGLEHQNSHVDIVSAFGLDDPFLPSLYAHEIFHAWNVKRLRPAELWPYRYDAPQPTTLLWVSEGITDYYADLLQLRGAIVDSAAFLELTTAKVNEVAGLPAVSLEDASLATWVHPVDGTSTIYYPKGSLAGLLLDALVRDASDNRRSLDDVMRELYQASYRQGRGFTDEQLWAAVTRAAGRSLDWFRLRHVDGREPFPYDSVLPLAGLRLRADTARMAQLGMLTEGDSAGVRVVALEAGGAAEAAGIREGDHLVALGDLRVDDPSFTARFRARYGRSAGERIPVKVRRAGREVALQVEARFVTRLTYSVGIDPRAGEKARRIRAGIFVGRIDAPMAGGE